jgi:MYXO-CTERM domain-containing protein
MGKMSAGPRRFMRRSAYSGGGKMLKFVRTLFAVFVAVVTLLGHAAASTVTVSFSVSSASWKGSSPFGLSSEPTLTGSLSLNTSNPNQLTSLDWVTGSRVWSLSDVSSFSANVAGNSVSNFDLLFGPGNYVYSVNTASITDGTNLLSCNNCVMITSEAVSTPNPSAIYLFATGLAALGLLAWLRRRKAPARWLNENLTPLSRTFLNSIDLPWGRMKMRSRPLSLLFICAVLFATNLTPTRASTIQFNVSGTVGSDTLTGVLTYDTSLPANGLASVYTSLSLTLAGSQVGVGGLIAATYNTVGYWASSANPPYYGVLSCAVGCNQAGFTGYGNTIGLYIGSLNGPGTDPITLGNTPFVVYLDQTYYQNGFAPHDNILVGSATLSETPIPTTLPLFAGGLGALGLFGWRRRKAGLTAA